MVRISPGAMGPAARLAALTAVKVTARLEREEEHEAWKVVYHDPTNAERGITIDLALQPEYRRMRTIAR